MSNNIIIPPVMKTLTDEQVDKRLGVSADEAFDVFYDDEKSQGIPVETLTTLARSRNQFYREHVYWHPNTPLEVLYDAMVCDSNDDLRWIAASAFSDRTNDFKDTPADMPDARARYNLASDKRALESARARSVEARKASKPQPKTVAAITLPITDIKRVWVEPNTYCEVADFEDYSQFGSVQVVAHDGYVRPATWDIAQGTVTLGTPIFPRRVQSADAVIWAMMQVAKDACGGIDDLAKTEWMRRKGVAAKCSASTPQHIHMHGIPDETALLHGMALCRY